MATILDWGGGILLDTIFKEGHPNTVTIVFAFITCFWVEDLNIRNVQTVQALHV
jgi:hypothetical protein